MKDLLILNCSKSKCSDIETLLALERYNGVAFRVVRKFLQQRKPDYLDIFILSAKFGLISSNELISNYDQKMDKKRSQELQSTVNAKFCELLQSGFYKRCLLCLSQDYLQIFNNYEKVIPEKLTVTIATGTIGKKLSILHHWLYGKPPEYLHTVKENTVKGKATLKGTEVNLSKAEIVAIARQGLIEGQGKPYNYQTWYVLVDDKKVSPKWLVSQLTGLPVSSFHSIKARQILQQLGIEIYSEL
ncbi:DUF6884 domain-containing protein [[Phormidium ambiguum] IAM M-71]|uniref:DUF6884 domain-containing protein n=1 Tax=[Phormidium ambiguum] IAM M-71 TaxID=454136 RepID=UPI000A024829|nr:DUF6884 domain-containing protein [Phormidium ambiguum]